jgi:molybdate transport repressor ModE-like protein
LDLHRLLLLREIKLRGSMSAAARTLAYTHSAISQQMSILEKETGVVLLERVGRGVRLTHAAERLVRHTEAVLSILEHAESDLASSHGEIKGSIIVAAFSTVSRVAIPAALMKLSQLYPELRVDFVQHEPEESLALVASRRLDLVIADEFPGTPLSVSANLHAELIAEEPVGAYLPAGVAADRAAELGLLDWVLEPAGTGSYSWAQRLCREVGFEPRIRYQSPDLLFHLRMVEAGLAAAFLPALAIAESSTELHRSDIFPSDLRRGIYAVTREGSRNRPTVLACQAVIAQELTALQDPKSSARVEDL